MHFTAALQTLREMFHATIALLPNLVIAAALLGLSWLGARGGGNAVQSLLQRAHRPTSVALVFNRLTRWLLMGMGMLIALTIAAPSVNARSLLSALGVGGVAVAFAFKDIFQNLLAGLLLLVMRPFSIGDVIISGNHEGTVEDIQTRATLVRTYDNLLVVIPNSDLYTHRVTVLSAKPQRRGQITVGIGYDEDVAKAKALIMTTVSALPQVEKSPPPVVLATELADSSVNLVVRYWVGPSTGRDLAGTTDAVIVAVKRALDDAGVEIAYPTQTLHVQTQAPANNDGTSTLQNDRLAPASV